MPTSPQLPPKKEVALALLANSSVYVHLDPRVDGVLVPPWFKKQPQLVLQIGLNMPVPIPDLHLDELGLSCTLSFNRSPFHCMVPWAAIYAMVDEEHRAMVWPEDVPPEVRQADRERPPAEGPAPAPARKEARDPKKGSRIAEVRSGSPKAKPARKQGKLAAVPAPAKSAPDAAAAAPKERAVPKEKPSERDVAASSRPRAEPTATTEPAPAEPPSTPAAAPPARPVAARPAPARKGKRELTPYLRVVK